jgi:hypothetical protein
MHRKTSTIIGIAIATILTAYISALTMSNQAFAQPGGIGNPLNADVQSAQTHVRQALGGQDNGRWIVDTGVFQALAGHEAQAAKVLAGELLGHTKQFGITLPPTVCLKLKEAC